LEAREKDEALVAGVIGIAIAANDRAGARRRSSDDQGSFDKSRCRAISKAIWKATLRSRYISYLPPNYARNRAPVSVIYFLHGYSVGAQAYVRMLGMPEVADVAMASGKIGEMIIVLPVRLRNTAACIQTP
jgi:enterochelin esterase-like enzyme